MTRFRLLQRLNSVRSRGVSLIELLVALTIGSLLIIGAVTVYMNSRNTYRTNETAARLQEVARYALDTLEPDVRLAGYWGLTGNPIYMSNASAPTAPEDAIDATVSNNCGTNFTTNAAVAIEGRDGETTGGAGFDMTCPAVDPVDWSDVLVVRRASSDTTAFDSQRLQVQSMRMQAVMFNDGAMPPCTTQRPPKRATWSCTSTT